MLVGARPKQLLSAVDEEGRVAASIRRLEHQVGSAVQPAVAACRPLIALTTHEAVLFTFYHVTTCVRRVDRHAIDECAG